MEFHNTQDVGYHSGQGLGIIYPKETKKALVMDKSEAHLEKLENQVSSTYQEKLKSQQSKQTKIFAMNMKDLEKHFFFFQFSKVCHEISNELILLLNVRGIFKSHENIVKDDKFQLALFICLTETHTSRVSDLLPLNAPAFSYAYFLSA